ncbi:hypothetical protein LB506_005160 [Fusarium annulatum]|nr:hypothetical protein LB506_005160 [Fusarium annulatum]
MDILLSQKPHFDLPLQLLASAKEHWAISIFTQTLQVFFLHSPEAEDIAVVLIFVTKIRITFQSRGYSISWFQRYSIIPKSSPRMLQMRLGFGSLVLLLQFLAAAIAMNGAMPVPPAMHNAWPACSRISEGNPPLTSTILATKGPCGLGSPNSPVTRPLRAMREMLSMLSSSAYCK